MAKLPLSIDVSAPPTLTATANVTVTTMQINKFLKLMPDTTVRMEESTPVQPTAMEAETNTATMDPTLTNIPKETTAYQSTTMDVTPLEPATLAAPPAPAVDPCIHLTTLSVLPGPPIIATIAAARSDCYEHSTKGKQNQQEEVEYRKAHKSMRWTNCTPNEHCRPVLRVPSVVRRPVNAQPVAVNSVQNRKLMKQPVKPALKLARRRSGKSRPQRPQHRPNKHCLPVNQKAIVHVTSLITVMIAIEKKPSWPLKDVTIDYISPLQWDAEVQRCLEALKNPPKPVFKVPLPPAPLIDVEQATSSTASLPLPTTSLPPMAPPSTPATTVATITSLLPMASMPAQSTTPTQPSLVITTHPVLRAALGASAALHFEPRLPSEATTLPNYVHFWTMDPPHSITLATPRFRPRPPWSLSHNGCSHSCHQRFAGPLSIFLKPFWYQLLQTSSTRVARYSGAHFMMGCWPLG
uniref:Uncharacterized protein n=1 Tax=Romanomermis culicivorax TaxID=13658 RepID=A0A915K0Y3_ROMCU